MKRPVLALWAFALVAGVLLARCASVSNVQLFACDANRHCPNGLTCNADGLCAPAEACTGIAYLDDGGVKSSVTDNDLDGRLGCADPQCAGKSCDTANVCSTGNTCLPDGGCGGGSICNSPAVCQLAAGATCGSTGCAYATAPDGTECDGGATPVCQLGPAKCGSGVCQFTLASRGSACSSGICDGDGGCVGFGYVPSNFDPAVLVGNVGGPIMVTCADAGIDTDVGAGSGCIDGLPLATAVVTSQSRELLVVSSLGLTVEAGAALHITGSRPVVFAVFGGADVSGTIEAGAQGILNGAGEGPCPVGALDATGGQGGAGAGFGAIGGSGGSANASGHGPNGGAVIGTEDLIPLRGGCSGGASAESSSSLKGGGGGGAVQISTSGLLRVTGEVLVPGGGGQGGRDSSGGSGGGSGGGILLEGNRVTVSTGAVLAANGGSGGEGGAIPANDAGSDGQDGQASTTQATTVSTYSGTGAGGQGGVIGFPAETGGNPTCLIGCSGTGGGGGGAVGRIRVNAVAGCTLSSNAVVTPTPTTNVDGGCG